MCYIAAARADFENCNIGLGRQRLEGLLFISMPGEGLRFLFIGDQDIDIFLHQEFEQFLRFFDYRIAGQVQ